MLFASTTRPAAGALIGVPDGLRKSAPLCALRGSPLKMLRVPNALLALCGTGRTNVVQCRSGSGDVQIAFISPCSARMRGKASAGGFTKFGSTDSRRVGKAFFVTVNTTGSRTSAPAAVVPVTSAV